MNIGVWRSAKRAIMMFAREMKLDAVRRYEFLAGLWQF